MPLDAKGFSTAMLQTFLIRASGQWREEILAELAQQAPAPSG